MVWTIHQASIEFGVDRRSLAKWISQLGIDVKAGEKYHTKVIHRAIAGDYEFEKTRLTRADADIREMDREVQRGQLVSLEQVARILNPIMITVKQRLDALPSEAGSRCNPTDPAHAEQQLRDWVDRTRPQLRELLPKPPAAGAPAQKPAPKPEKTTKKTAARRRKQ